ncbi:unnamed protein product [Sphagnum troendelagicum]|uniref:Uncharacterized protein n=1 Tax=Sphagnum troendelagicum TaxID=128251 RepID=A0ABP0TA30_9BRYO
MFQNLVWEAGGVAEVSKVEGRVAQTTDMVLGGTVSEDTPDDWNIIDQKVRFFHSSECVSNGLRLHSHWHLRGQLCASMVGAVESVIETQIPEVHVVYDAMKRDVQMKYFL